MGLGLDGVKKRRSCSVSSQPVIREQSSDDLVSYRPQTPHSRLCLDGRLPGRDRQPMTLHAGYAASRISSKLRGSTKQFGRLQAPATKLSFLSATSRYPASIRICSFSLFEISRESRSRLWATAKARALTLFPFLNTPSFGRNVN